MNGSRLLRNFINLDTNLMTSFARRVVLGAFVSLVVMVVDRAPAQEGEPPRGEPARGPEAGPSRNQTFQPFGRGPRTLAIREALDTDKDAKVSADEMKAAAASLKNLDRNGDKKLTADEIGWPPQFGPGRGGRGGPGGFGRGGRGGASASPQEFAKRILVRDANSDGAVSADELPRSMQVVLSLADTNADRKIDEAEAVRFAEKFGFVSRPASKESQRGAADATPQEEKK
jgi:hypothetical protein